MKPYLLETLHCPSCANELEFHPVALQLVCRSCNQPYTCTQFSVPNSQLPIPNSPLIDHQLLIPIFTPPPDDIVPSEKIARSPDIGTPWRQANWRFLQAQVARLSPDSLILDVGSGRGDFTAALQKHRSIALEVYPYPEVDVVCDLTQTNPFRANCFDAILLLNVLEHVYDTHALLGTLASLLKPGGCLIMAIPFMVKIHQAPVDYVRYTHFALQRLGEQHGLQVDLLEGYYDPVFFLGEGIGNLKNAVLPEMQVAQRRLANLRLRGIQFLANGLQRSLDSIGYNPGKTIDPSGIKSLTPTGYHVIYRKRIELSKQNNEI